MTRDSVLLGFEKESVRLAVGALMPLRQLGPTLKASHKYKQILSSIREVGVVEPPVVVPAKDRKGAFLLLDGHLRVEALKDIGIEQVTCLVSTDDEAFTYNKRVNRIATIQEHKMILKAEELGVPEDRIARALDVDVASIRRKRRLLEGICPEAAELLRDRHCPINMFAILKKMAPLRQIEAAELMVSLNSYTEPYARALLAATPQDQLAEPAKPKAIRGVTTEQLARMEREMAGLQREYKAIEANYGADNLCLTVARGYVSRLIGNPKVTRYLSQHHPELLQEFRTIVESEAGSRVAV